MHPDSYPVRKGQATVQGLPDQTAHILAGHQGSSHLFLLSGRSFPRGPPLTEKKKALLSLRVPAGNRPDGLQKKRSPITTLCTTPVTRFLRPGKTGRISWKHSPFQK
ncbi:hypothetical protein LptCag_1121 [Leptospirillum ferriphilum]|uniref:Uncharacterized protein n=1 Tax=Leptospirillum ferriphilum TaxID=178606 RepID=A0A094W9Y4_9BACT|nr:hypothetical protein LptCag_1121 [Leptospirillum ferriphilum]